VAFALLVSPAVRAQISPGELSRAHASLDGVENCKRCHSSKSDEVPAKCTECHTRIADQRRTGRGLHAKSKFADCVLCHVEHQGRDFELVHFEGGTAAFDHGQTGYALTGRHAGLECRKCHTPEHIRDDGLRRSPNVDIKRTYLGLKADCASCHFDEHRGQMKGTCESCHTTAGWRPASGFDHQRTAFALAGRHATVACEKCHALEPDAKNASDHDFRRFAPVAHAQCSDCHKDPHQGRLGPTCDGCHTAADWRQVKGASFDHERTRYPLRGRHRQVACERCHTTRTAGKLAFGACRDCHADYHQGAFAKIEGKGACEACHSVEGFSPSSYTMEKHARGDFPLGGAHLAVPCVACHLVPGATGGEKHRFAWSSTRCRDCHRDPHGGQVDRLVSDQGCETCHSVDSWQVVKFDHAVTKYPLEAKHAAVACLACHARSDEARPGLLRFTLPGSRCSLCHADVHRGQFVDADPEDGTDCGRCHEPAGWKPAKFDHGKARFVLDGAHIRVPCALCHKPVTDEAGTWVPYKPLDTRCVACHEGPLPSQDGKS
jgi:hypothetical protein